jgi:hypothetical protein
MGKFTTWLSEKAVSRVMFVGFVFFVGPGAGAMGMSIWMQLAECVCK